MSNKVVKQGVNCVFPKWEILYSCGILPKSLEIDDDHYPWFAEQAAKYGLDPELHIERRDPKYRSYKECNVAVSNELFEKICKW